jgi:Fe-coproporphyrin III synthase
LKKLGTKKVLMSGGEALLHPNFFRLCELLQKQHIGVSLLSTGITLKQHAPQLVKHVQDIIVSLDGDEPVHNQIRNIPDAFQKLKAGVQAIKALDPSFRITTRTVIHRGNYRVWPAIIATAKEMGADQVSFLPADISSHAFNREVLWSDQRQQDVLPSAEELEELHLITEQIIARHPEDFENGFIAEQPDKLRKIHQYYTAQYGQNPFPYKKCNAPWVSAVVEADGTVRPCFFHAAQGNIHTHDLESILNNDESIRFRKELDMSTNETCIKCVCYLNLGPGTRIQ